MRGDHGPFVHRKPGRELKKSGKFITWKNNEFIEMKQDDYATDEKLQEKLWNISLDLCNDEKTVRIAGTLI